VKTDPGGICERRRFLRSATDSAFEQVVTVHKLLRNSQRHQSALLERNCLGDDRISARPPGWMYIERSRPTIMEILRTVTPVIEKVSLDEAYLDISAQFDGHHDQDGALEAAVNIAQDLKTRIFNERNLTSSIGVASNKFLAKVGSDFKKSNGLTV
jgi:nucleotidyltransferase/DNA polymerase involved in DNA repair